MWLYDPVAAAAIARRSMRNLHLFLASDTEHSIGGLHVNGGLTNKVFLDILENILLVGEPFTVEREGFGNVGRDDDRTRSGRYIIHGNVQVTDEPYYPRTVSPPSSPSDYSYDFHYDVRNRDRGCQLTRKVNRGARFDEWTGYDVVHIIPREHYFRIIGNTMDPVRNGILMCSHIHKQFVQYQFSINPDDGYKIIDFGEDNLELDGTVLRGQCIRSSKGVSDHCLRWHFRQAVLANMRGDGEPLAVDRFSFTL